MPRVIEWRAMKARFFALALLALTACKKDPPSSGGGAEKSKLGAQLVGKWNDGEDGSLAWEFMEGGKCKAFGNMDCEYQVASEKGSTLVLRYKATSSWEDVEVTFEGQDAAVWKNLTEIKADPETAPTKLTRAK